MTPEEIIKSGILELYVVGDISPEEKALVDYEVRNNDLVKQELKEIEESFELFAVQHEMPVPPTHKPMLFAALNFQERIEKGEIITDPPSLNEQSTISDFAQWLSKEELQEPEEYDSVCGRIINSNEEKTTLIVWMKDGAPDEIHVNEHEKFLIVEGTCKIKIGEKVHDLKAGDFLSIPLFITHSVQVTSDERCKIILERAAA